MKLEVLRFNSADDFTNGILFDVSNNKRQFLAYTLEDQAQTTKVLAKQEYQPIHTIYLLEKRVAFIQDTKQNLAQCTKV